MSRQDGQIESRGEINNRNDCWGGETHLGQCFFTEPGHRKIKTNLKDYPIIKKNLLNKFQIFLYSPVCYCVAISSPSSPPFESSTGGLYEMLQAKVRRELMLHNSPLKSIWIIRKELSQAAVFEAIGRRDVEAAQSQAGV